MAARSPRGEQQVELGVGDRFLSALTRGPLRQGWLRDDRSTGVDMVCIGGAQCEGQDGDEYVISVPVHGGPVRVTLD